MLFEAGDDAKLDGELLVVTLVAIDAVDDDEELIVLELSIAEEDNEFDEELAVALLVDKTDELLKEADIKLVVLLAVEILELIVLDPLELVEVEVVMAMLDAAEDENELDEASIWEVLADDVTKLLVGEVIELPVDEAAELLVNETAALLEGVEVELCIAVEPLLNTEAELIDDSTVVLEYVVVFNVLESGVLDELNPVLVDCKAVALVLVVSEELVGADTLKLLLVEIDVELLGDDTIVLLVNDVPVEYVDGVDVKEPLAVESTEALADEFVGMVDDGPPEVDTDVGVMGVPVLVEVVVDTIGGLANEYVVGLLVEDDGDQDPVPVALDNVEIEEGTIDVLVEVPDVSLVDEAGVVDVWPVFELLVVEAPEGLGTEFELLDDAVLGEVGVKAELPELETRLLEVDEVPT